MSNRTRTTLIAALLFVAILIAVVPFPVSNHDRPLPAPRNACISNLKSIDGAKAGWALEARKIPEDTPTDTDLFGPERQLRDKPTCPAGGTYILGKVSEKPL